jgi:hypothetical protein
VIEFADAVSGVMAHPRHINFGSAPLASRSKISIDSRPPWLTA